MIKLEIKDNATLHKAVRKYGKDAQLLVAVEEMAELTHAICKRSRGRNSNIAEEMADVYIMLQQMQIMFENGITVQNWIDLKVERLKKVLEEDETK